MTELLLFPPKTQSPEQSIINTTRPPYPIPRTNSFRTSPHAPLIHTKCLSRTVRVPFPLSVCSCLQERPPPLPEKSAIEWQRAQLRHWEHAHGRRVQLQIGWISCAMNLGLFVAAVPIRALLLPECEEVDVDSICHSFLRCKGNISTHLSVACTPGHLYLIRNTFS